MNRKQWIHLGLGALALLLLHACSPSAPPVAKKVATKPKIVATTGMVADLARQILQDDVEITCLMGAAADPHSYTPSPGDVKTLEKADVIVANGLHLEGRMQDYLTNLQKKGRAVLFLGDSLSPGTVLSDTQGSGAAKDPHIWGDLSIWSLVVDLFATEMGRIYPSNITQWKNRATAYHTDLLKNHAALKETVKRIPEAKRVLVTSHDAFRYFGRGYGFTVKGVGGLSTVGEVGLRDSSELSAFIKEHQLKAIFIESSVSPKTIERLSQDSGASIGGKLFSDALGIPGEVVTLPDGTTRPKDTVIGMQWTNMLTIVDALGE